MIKESAMFRLIHSVLIVPMLLAMLLLLPLSAMAETLSGSSVGIKSGGAFATGTCISQHDGLWVLTCAHLWKGDQRTQATVCFDDSCHPAALVKIDHAKDLALLHVKGVKRSSAAIAEKPPTQGQRVISMGYTSGQVLQGLEGVVPPRCGSCNEQTIPATPDLGSTMHGRSGGGVFYQGTDGTWELAGVCSYHDPSHRGQHAHYTGPAVIADFLSATEVSFLCRHRKTTPPMPVDPPLPPPVEQQPPAPEPPKPVEPPKQDFTFIIVAALMGSLVCLVSRFGKSSN